MTKDQTRSYPYKGWVLLPSYKPVEVEFTHSYQSFGGEHTWDVAKSGRVYAISSIYPDKIEAIQHGWTALANAEAALQKRMEKIEKQRAALTKAERATK